MKGLILKDLYITKNNSKFFLLFLFLRLYKNYTKYYVSFSTYKY